MPQSSLHNNSSTSSGARGGSSFSDSFFKSCRFFDVMLKGRHDLLITFLLQQVKIMIMMRLNVPMIIVVPALFIDYFSHWR